jgi:ketosteroid isomerase-like protein
VSSAEEVLARADAWQTSLEARDVEGIKDYLHADYALVLIKPAHVTMPREEWLRLLPEYVVHGSDVVARTVDVDGDVAMVLQIVDQRATVAGGDRSGLFVISDCWRRDPDDGAWRVWKRHSTPLAAGAMPRAAEG